MISGRTLDLSLAFLIIWLLLLLWLLQQNLSRSEQSKGARAYLSLAGLVCSSLAVAALLALHLTWISTNISQRIGSTSLHVLATLIVWPTLIGLISSLAGVGKARFISVASCLATGLWFFSLSFGAALSGSASSRHADNFYIPDGYVGWVCVDYNVRDTSPLPMDSDELQYRFPSSGLIKTSSKLEDGWARDRYFYYTSSGEQKELRATAWKDGGMIWDETTGGTSDGHGGMIDLRQEFFVGTEQQFNQASNAAAACGPVKPTTKE